MLHTNFNTGYTTLELFPACTISLALYKQRDFIICVAMIMLYLKCNPETVLCVLDRETTRHTTMQRTNSNA
jgi:hypothetical protein